MAMLKVFDSASRRRRRKPGSITPTRPPLGVATTVARMFPASLQQRMLWLTICCSYVVYVNSLSVRPIASAHPPSSSSALVSATQELLWNPMNINISRRCGRPYQRILRAMISGTDVKYENQISQVDTNDEPDASKDFQLLIQMAILTLVRSDTDGNELVHSYGSASQGLWLNLPAAKELQGLLDRVVLKVRAE